MAMTDVLTLTEQEARAALMLLQGTDAEAVEAAIARVLDETKIALTPGKSYTLAVTVS
jgi:hypothetical protein